MQKISIVIPVFNEEGNLQLVYTRLTEIFNNQLSNFCYEILFINDGSHDTSWQLITHLCQKDNRIKGISFSRNFGHQAALTAGYDYTNGDAIISMDADLQDPPELIVDMIHAWQKGFDIVYARRIDRQDSLLKKWTALIYYRVLDSVSEVKIPRNVGDFRLIDKKVLHVLQHCRERARYLRGMVAWVGFKHMFIDFKRPNRNSGITGYTWKKMFKLAFDGLTGFSLFPLKIAAYLGLFIVFTGSLMFAYVTFDAFWHGVYYPLFKWLVIVLYIFTGMQMLLLWLIGEYIGRMHDQQKERPLYVISQTCESKKRDN